MLYSLFISLLFLPYLTFCQQYVPILNVNYGRIPLGSTVTGPESLAFDVAGGGPYTGVSDGRILKWQDPVRGWTEFAVSSWNR